MENRATYLKKRLNVYLRPVIQNDPLIVRLFMGFLAKHDALEDFIYNLEFGRPFNSSTYKQLIGNAFVWHESREGETYWATLHALWMELFERIENIATYGTSHLWK